MSHIERARDVLKIEIDALATVSRDLDAGFDRATDLILSVLSKQGKIVVTGVGKNLHIADKISATFASTGATSVVLHPTQAVHGDLGVLSARDVLLALSYSGESEELLAILPVVSRLGIPMIALTAEPESTLATRSEVVISIRVDREACPFGMAPTASTTATLALGDALAMALLDARGFKKEDYALLHPAGSIGKSLLLRAEDIMRRGERVARVSHGATVRDAIMAMTAARCGSAAIVDDEGMVQGILTDGDLRRHMPDTPDLLTMAASQIMTPSPITVNADRLAVDILRLFEQHNIDDLLVVDTAGHLVGAVDIQDLPKLKIL